MSRRPGKDAALPMGCQARPSHIAFKDEFWSELAYIGLVEDPLYADLKAFVDQSQKRVNGSVKMRLFCESAMTTGRQSPDALYSQDMVSFDSQTLSQKDAEGFAKYHGFPGEVDEEEGTLKARDVSLDLSGSPGCRVGSENPGFH